MGEARYNTAYRKGIEDGKRLKTEELGYSNCDEAYAVGYKDAIQKVIGEIIEVSPDIEELFKWLVEESKC